VFLRVGGADTKRGAVFKRQDSTTDKNAVALKAAAELDRSAADVLWRHFSALFIKRWHYSKRDTKAWCFQLFIPILFLVIGLAILNISSLGTFPAKTLSTANLNAPFYVPFNPSPYALDVNALVMTERPSPSRSLDGADLSPSLPVPASLPSSAAVVRDRFGGSDGPRALEQRPHSVLLQSALIGRH
jgi:hypothetical protein